MSDEHADLRAFISSGFDTLHDRLGRLETRVDAVANRSMLPAWARSVAIAALSAAISALAVRATTHVQWTTPGVVAEVKK